MATNYDKNKHVYVEVDTIRITFIPAKDRTKKNDWSGSDVIRIQAYKEPNSKKLHRGAELPIHDINSLNDLLQGISQAYTEGKPLA